MLIFQQNFCSTLSNKSIRFGRKKALRFLSISSTELLDHQKCKNPTCRRQKNSEPISFVNANTCFIKDNTLCISLENGDVYFLVLKRDSMNNVRAFHLRKSASAVISTTLTHLNDSLIFLGSRLGNSLLLKYTVVQVWGRAFW